MNTQQLAAAVECEVCGDEIVELQDKSKRTVWSPEDGRRCRVCAELARAYVLATRALTKN